MSQKKFRKIEEMNTLGGVVKKEIEELNATPKRGRKKKAETAGSTVVENENSDVESES